MKDKKLYYESLMHMIIKHQQKLFFDYSIGGTFQVSALNIRNRVFPFMEGVEKHFLGGQIPDPQIKQNL